MMPNVGAVNSGINPSSTPVGHLSTPTSFKTELSTLNLGTSEV